MKAYFLRKKATVFFLTLIVLSFLAVVFYNQYVQEPALKWPDDGIYFARWDSYHYYTKDENPYLQFSVFYINSQSSTKIPSIQNCELVSQTGDTYQLESIMIQPNDERVPCSLYNLSGSLSCLPPGNYIFKSIILTLKDTSEKTEYPIGTWDIDVDSQNLDENNKLIDVGKHTFIDGSFEDYRIELTNNTNSNIAITNFICKISEKDLHFSIFQSSDYSKITNDTSTILPSNEKKTFFFKISDAPTDVLFFSIKPKITYRYNSSEYVLNAPVAIYSPPLTDADICSYLMQFTQ